MSHLSTDPGEPSREREDARWVAGHISGQRLAALADDAPSADEREHLSRCADCAREWDAHRLLLAMANTERDAMRLPLTRWDALSTALRAEGLLTRPAAAAASRSRFFESRAMLQVAAALVLLAAGAVFGRVSVGQPPLPGDAPLASASSLSPDSLPTQFSSLEEASRWKNAYADAYQSTVTFLAANDSMKPAETPAAMRTRLSALDRVSRTMREALNDAPYDPVINDFYLNSFGQREATLRQLNTVLPQGVRLNSF